MPSPFAGATHAVLTDADRRRPLEASSADPPGQAVGSSPRSSASQVSRGVPVGPRAGGRRSGPAAAASGGRAADDAAPPSATRTAPTSAAQRIGDSPTATRPPRRREHDAEHQSGPGCGRAAPPARPPARPGRGLWDRAAGVGARSGRDAGGGPGAAAAAEQRDGGTERDQRDRQGELAPPRRHRARSSVVRVRLLRLLRSARRTRHGAGRSDCAAATARSTAIALLRHSSSSAAGSESATMPAPACT